MTLNNIKIRKYKMNDEFGIIKLFKEVFESDYSQKRWLWQIMNNIYGPGWIVVAEDKNGIIAHSSVRRNHVNFMGREIVAGQPCDLMVKKEYRRTGLSHEMIQKNLSSQIKEGSKLKFSFPNRDSYPGMRRPNNYRICYLREYYYRIGLKKIWGQRFDRVFKLFFSLFNLFHYREEKRILNRDVKIVSSNEISDKIGPMLDECHNYEVLSIWKDLDYMKWRYGKHPEYRYDFHTLFVDGKVEGFIVCRMSEDHIVMCEFINRTKNIRQSVIFLRHIVKHYFLKPVQSIEFCGWDNGFFDCIFSKSGFQRQLSSFVYIVRLLDVEDERLSQMIGIPDNWTVVIGDSDVI